MSRQTDSFEAFQAATALRNLASACGAIWHKSLSGAQTDVAKALTSRILFLHVVDFYLSYAIAYTDDVGVSAPLPPPTPQELEYS